MNHSQNLPSLLDMSNGNEPHLIGNEELCGSTIDKISKLGPISGRGVETVPYGVNTRFNLKLIPIQCYINSGIAIDPIYCVKEKSICYLYS